MNQASFLKEVKDAIFGRKQKFKTAEEIYLEELDKPESEHL